MFSCWWLTRFNHGPKKKHIHHKQIEAAGCPSGHISDISQWLNQGSLKATHFLGDQTLCKSRVLVIWRDFPSTWRPGSEKKMTPSVVNFWPSGASMMLLTMSRRRFAQFCIMAKGFLTIPQKGDRWRVHFEGCKSSCLKNPKDTYIYCPENKEDRPRNNEKRTYCRSLSIASLLGARFLEVYSPNVSKLSKSNVNRDHCHKWEWHGETSLIGQICVTVVWSLRE